MSPPKRTPLTMHEEEFELLRELIRERTGLALHQDGHRQLERRLGRRVSELNLVSFAEYHRLLRRSSEEDEELQHLWDLVTNKETYFFREDYQLSAFRREILPGFAEEARQKRALTCWSMGCSSGEEAYSIGIVLVESGLFDGWDLLVYGTDISRSCLAVARRAVYAESAFRSTSRERRSRFFRKRKGETTVVASVRRLCRFGQLNLVELPKRPVVEQVDAIFCRNVLIYFNESVRQSVVEAIYERLRPGGYLLLGHSESLLNEKTPFEVVHLANDVVYRKPKRSHREGRRR